MTFAEWFEVHLTETGRKRSDAIAALALDAGISHMVVRRALAGTALRPDTARKLADLTGGRVAAEPMVMAPTAPRVERDDEPEGEAAAADPEAAA